MCIDEAPCKGRGLVRPNTRKSTTKVTKKKQTKTAPPIGLVRDFPCRPCVTLATKAPGHECASQDNNVHDKYFTPLCPVKKYQSDRLACLIDSLIMYVTGAACWDCAKNGHTCRPVPVGALAAVRAFWELNRQLKPQQLRACGSGAALPAAPGPASALALFGEIAERSPEERKIMALETIAEAARLWIQLNKPDEEDEEDEEEMEEDN
ncbi:Hypothetical protein NCS54_01491200 [Fusarium falciforme]|uniref:Hypothetical protein n=1 Tax=Fusarium falciforme TaxID=195108 RepID=UPI0022FFCB30|nr:Hypothetical protein NCS54_01491200 [Fusarium falciforme]WAO97198.1 Hypothetical protein NCS54_01491200 [Fusarium falciforme]